MYTVYLLRLDSGTIFVYGAAKDATEHARHYTGNYGPDPWEEHAQHYTGNYRPADPLEGPPREASGFAGVKLEGEHGTATIEAVWVR